MTEIADAAGTTLTSLSEWEGDKKAPREKALMKLAKVLGVTPAYLRYGVGDVPMVESNAPQVPIIRQQGRVVRTVADEKHKKGRG